MLPFAANSLTPADQIGSRLFQEPLQCQPLRLITTEPPRWRQAFPLTQGKTARTVPAASARTEQGANRMTGLVPAIPLSTDRSQASVECENFLTQSGRLPTAMRSSTVSDGAHRHPCCALPPARPLGPVHENGAFPQDLHGALHRNRGPQSPGFRKHDPSIEPGHSRDRHSEPDRPRRPQGRLQRVVLYEVLRLDVSGCAVAASLWRSCPSGPPDPVRTS